MQEDDTEKTWDDTEMVIKKMIREKLGIEGDVRMEREHHKPGDSGQTPARSICLKFEGLQLELLVIS